MKRNVTALTFLSLLTLLLTVATASAVDLAGYMGLKAGKWAIWQDDDADLFGIVVRKNTSGQFLRDWYINKGSGWKFDSTEIWRITADALIIVGSNDGTDVWKTVPQLTIPRSLPLNAPFFYTGVLKNKRTGATNCLTYAIIITKNNIDSVSVPAGTFDNCITCRSFDYFKSEAESSDTVDLMCPGRFFVKKWKNKITDTSDPQQEEQHTGFRELISYGDANPPFP